MSSNSETRRNDVLLVSHLTLESHLVANVECTPRQICAWLPLCLCVEPLDLIIMQMSLILFYACSWLPWQGWGSHACWGCAWGLYVSFCRGAENGGLHLWSSHGSCYIESILVLQVLIFVSQEFGYSVKRLLLPQCYLQISVDIVDLHNNIRSKLCSVWSF